MPSTWERWGSDFDGDGVANPWDPDDGVYAAARYLAAAGAAEDLSRAIFAYNHADWYVQDVLELARVFSGGGGFDPSLGSSPGIGFGARRRGRGLPARLISRSGSRTRGRRVNKAQRAVLDAEERAQELDDPGARGRAARRRPEPYGRASSRRSRARSRSSSSCTSATLDRVGAQARGARPGGGARRRPARRGRGAGDHLHLHAHGRHGGLRHAAVLRPVRLPGRRRPVGRLGRGDAPRLPGRGHRRAGGLAPLRARGRHRHATPSRARPTNCGIGFSMQLADRRDLPLLPPLVHGAADRARARRSRPARRSASSARRATRPARTCTSSTCPRQTATRRTRPGSSRSPGRPSRGRAARPPRVATPDGGPVFTFTE